MFNQFIINKIINNIEYNKYYTNSIGTAEIKISNNEIELSKIKKGYVPFCWFGFDNIKSGTYTVSFDIFSDKKLIQTHDIGIKSHQPLEMYNSFVPEIIPNKWTHMEEEIHLYIDNDLLIFIFDRCNDFLNIKIKNLEIKKVEKIKTINKNNSITFCFHGFVRDYPPKYKIDIKKFNNYIYVPSTRNENNRIKITNDQIYNVYGNNSKIVIYDYDKYKFIKKSKKLNIPKFNKYYQQSYRIFSFFNNLKESLLTLDINKITDDEIIILCRIDIGISVINYSKINELLRNNDIIIHRRAEDQGYDDKYFVFKKKSINVFLNLYDDYEKYLIDFYHNNNPDKLDSTRPEDIISLHFKKYNQKIAIYAVIHYRFHHVCSEFCGHNKKNTKT